MQRHDVIVAGAGPAGSAAAAVCAQGGLSVLILEKSRFPREKVCGDCLNPSCWPILERLELGSRVCELPHAVLQEVHFACAQGEPVRLPLPQNSRPEIAVKRSHFDSLLLSRAVELGAQVREGATVAQVSRKTPADGPDLRWEVRAGSETFCSRWLIAADGRNSTVARLLDLLPSLQPDRVGFQTHFPLPAAETGRVTMRFLPWGYCGLADVGSGFANLCLVALPKNAAALKAWAAERFHLPAAQPWKTITPLSRASVPPVHDGLFLAGDAARVVEPFTGEGIYYALASGELAARHLLANDPDAYARAHAQLYRGRLWINRLARQACLHPAFAEGLLAVARRWPAVLTALLYGVIK